MDLGGLKEFVKDLTLSADQRAVSKALKHYAKGQIDKAIEVLKEGHQAAPESAPILFEMARLLALADRGAEAADALRTILRRSPGAFDRVSELIEEVRARHVQVGPLYDAVAEHFVRQDDLKSALGALERMKPEEIRGFVPRHRGKWESIRKAAVGARLARTSLHSAYYLALSHEALREPEPASEIYRLVARHNPEEVARVLPRLEALLARDYQNATLRLSVADLCLGSGREEEATQHFTVALETDPRCAATLAGRLEPRVASGEAGFELRVLLVSAHLAAKNLSAALETMRPLVESGEQLDRLIGLLQPLAGGENSGAAKRLLATALARRGQPQSALETLLQVAEEEGIRSIREPLEALAAAGPGLTRVHLILADIYLEEGRAGAAVESLRRAREQAPGEESLLVPRVIRVLEGDPASPDAHLLLADLLARGGERQRSVVVLRHLTRVSPTSAGEALARLEAILKEDQGSPRARIGTLEACLELQQHPQALEHLEAIVSSHAALDAEFLHAAARLASEAPGLAPRLVETLRALEPRAAHPHAVRFVRGEAAFHGGDPAGAAAIFRDVLQAAPERTEEVRQALERFDRADPRAVEARVILATLYLEKRDHAAAILELGRGPAGEALLGPVLSKYEEILAAAPGDREATAGYVQVLLLARQFDKVLSVGQEAVRDHHDAAAARITLAMGDALRDKGDSDGAVKRYYAAYGRDRAAAGDVTARLAGIVRAEGAHPLASLALGKVQGAEGDAAGAVEALRAAWGADPKLRDSVLSELRGMLVSCPGEPQVGVLTLRLLREGREIGEALKLISTLLDAHPGLTPSLLEHLEEILKSDPDQPFAHYEMGRALQRQGLVPRAAAVYLQAGRLDPNLTTMIQKRLLEMVETTPGAPEPYLAACALHAARGRFPAAAEIIEKGLRALPGETARFLPRLEEIWQQNRGSARIGLLFAQACLAAGKYDRALLAFGEALQRDPGLLDAVSLGYEAILKACPKMGAAYLARARASARRMRLDESLADLGRAVRLDADLLSAALEESEALRARFPESAAVALFLADVYLAAGRDADARRLLQSELDRGPGKPERLSLLIRLWRLATAAQDDESARAFLEEASALASEPRQFLWKVHEAYVAMLRARAERLLQRVDQGSRRTTDAQSAIRTLIDLGDLHRARTLLDRHASGIDAAEAGRLRAEIALRSGDYARAAEQLRPLGPSRELAFGAARTGDLALAASALEGLLQRGGHPSLQIALAKIYRDLVEADLLGGGRRLQAETILTFGEGAAA